MITLANKMDAYAVQILITAEWSVKEYVNRRNFANVIMKLKVTVTSLFWVITYFCVSALFS